MRVAAALGLVVCLGAYAAPEPGRMDSVFSCAEALYAAGDYDAAITEYKRCLFLSSEPATVGAAYHRIGLGLRSCGRWTESIAALKRSIQAAESAEQKWLRQMDLLATMIAAGRYAGAEYQIAMLAASPAMNGPDTVERTSLDTYAAALYALTYRWKEAEAAVVRIESSERPGAAGRSEECRDLLDLLREAQEARRKSPLLARWLSAFLPGAGQVYAGDLRSGLGALAVNSVSVGLLVVTLVRKRYLESALLSLYVVGRFYGGNLSNAEALAREWNHRVDEDYAERILRALAAVQGSPAERGD
jgi:tetratricopeptide (TPR) repeat protein